MNDFDVLNGGANSSIEMSYGSQGSGQGAVLGQKTVNLVGDTVGVLLSGFSFHYIRDDRPAGVPDRATHLYRILQWLENAVGLPVGEPGPGYENTLSQNYPNPFNPTTTIRYSVKERARVSLKIYSVAGQLVKTLVDGQKLAGLTHKEVWNGRDNRGEPVASGVYFYRFVTKDFVKTKKMVLLK